MFKATIISVIICFFNVSSYAQNLTQLSFIESSGIVFSVKSQGDYLYFVDFRGSFSFFKSVDVSKPNEPAVLDSFMTAGFITDFDLNENYAYLSMADNEFGLRILDLSDPSNIQEVLFLEGSESVGTFFQDDTLYVADGGGLSVYDASKPDTLAFSWFFSTNQFGDGISVFVFENLIYLTANSGGLFIINSATRDLEGMLTSADASLGVAANEDHAFFTDDVLGLIAVDVSNPQAPVSVDTLNGNGEFAGDVSLSRDFLYYCDGQNGLRVIDVSDPLTLLQRDSFAPDRIFAIRVALHDSLVYLASGDFEESGDFLNGVFILKNDFSTSIQEATSLVPVSFVLTQNFPNPFNPTTTISYELPKNTNVLIVIYDIAGRKVKELVNRGQQAGVYLVKWDGKNEIGQAVASGVYIYKIVAGTYTKSNKMILLK